MLWFLIHYFLFQNCYIFFIKEVISMDINEKLDAIMNMVKGITLKLEEHDKKFDLIDKKFDAIDKKFNAIDKRFDAIDQRIDILTGNNREEHEKMMVLITNLASSFTRFEAEYTDKYKILFDMTQDYIEHKNISALQLTSLEEKVKNNSFRISKLEKAI